MGKKEVFAFIGFVSSFIAIVIFITGKKSLPEFVNNSNVDLSQSGSNYSKNINIRVEEYLYKCEKKLNRGEACQFKYEKKSGRVVSIDIRSEYAVIKLNINGITTDYRINYYWGIDSNEREQFKSLKKDNLVRIEYKYCCMSLSFNQGKEILSLERIN